MPVIFQKRHHGDQMIQSQNYISVGALQPLWYLLANLKFFEWMLSVIHKTAKVMLTSTTIQHVQQVQHGRINFSEYAVSDSSCGKLLSNEIF